MAHDDTDTTKNPSPALIPLPQTQVQPVATPPKKECFWLCPAIVETLILGRATAFQIAALLVIARYTDESGHYSTATPQLIHAHTGESEADCAGVVRSLFNMGILTTPKNYSAWTGNPLPAYPVNYALADDENNPQNGIWFPAGLVDGYEDGGLGFIAPLHRLIQRCGDIAARLLLACYQHHDLANYGGISPALLYHDYTKERKVKNAGGTAYDLWHATAGSFMVNSGYAFPICGAPIFPNMPVPQAFWDAFFALYHAGFIHEVVAVLDNPLFVDGAFLLNDVKTGYALYTKSVTPFNDDRNATAKTLAACAKALGHEIPSAQGRQGNVLAVLIPAESTFQVMGIFRVALTVPNPENANAGANWQRIEAGTREIKAWVDALKKTVVPG